MAREVDAAPEAEDARLADHNEAAEAGPEHAAVTAAQAQAAAAAQLEAQDAQPPQRALPEVHQAPEEVGPRSGRVSTGAFPDKSSGAQLIDCARLGH